MDTNISLFHDKMFILAFSVPILSLFVKPIGLTAKREAGLKT